MTRKQTVSFVSLAILILAIVAAIMYALEAGVLLKAGSNVFSANYAREYKAWDIVFGVERNGDMIIAQNTWGIIGLALIGLGGISVLLLPLRLYRFILGFFSFIASSIITALLPQLANFNTVNWGDLLEVKASLGTPLIISIILQGIAAILCAALFIMRPED